MKIFFRILGLQFLIVLISSCDAQTKTNPTTQTLQVKGVSFEASSSTVETSTLAPIKQLHANWISLMPYGFTNEGSPEIHFNESWQWKGERTEGIIESIQAARANQLQIMMKPHLWIKGQFTGNVTFETEEEWQLFEKTYQEYVLFYVKLAQEHKVELFCIGTELKQFVKQRPDYWNNLINEIKKNYSGKLIYAANWDNYAEIPFWEQLDYLGIDGYFPLSDQKTPEISELINAWNPWWSAINKTVTATQKNVIFTEIGYRSIDYCAKKPYESYKDLGDENQQAQYNSLSAFFETSKNYSFYKGAFIWKFHSDSHLPPKGNKKYTYQNKQSEALIQTYFKN